MAASGWIGLALLAAALPVMAGWLLRSSVLVAAIPGAHMVFGTALCFALAGAALAAQSLASLAWARRLRTILGAAIASIAALVLGEYSLGRDFGIDLAELHHWLTDDNPHPGRMAPVTALAFLACGTVLVWMDRVASLSSGIVVQALMAGVALLGAIGLAASVLDLSLVFPDSPFRQMAFATAAGFFLAAGALYLAWRQMPWHSTRSLVLDEAQRISLAGAAVLAAIVCASVLGAFAISSPLLRTSAQTGLLESLKGRVDLFRIHLESRSTRAEVLATRPSLVELFVALEERPADPAVIDRLRREAESALQFGFSAVAFYGTHGGLHGAAGRRTERPALTLPVEGRGRVALLWDDGFVLYSRLTVQHGEKSVGVMVAEQRLAAMSEALRSADDFAASAELVVCRRSANELDCVRQRPEPPVFQIAFAPSLPMTHALEGPTGVLTARDYRGHRVIAAHGPVGASGLGMVLKIDAAELYAPVREQMYVGLALMTAMVVAGVWLLRRRIGPLVRRLARSEQRLVLAVEGSRLALWDYDVAANSVYLDERWSAMLGGDAHSATTTPQQLMELVHPDDGPALQEHLREVVQGVASHYDIEHRVRTTSGEWLWIRSRGRVVEKDRAGRALRLAGTNADIHQRKLAEIALAHQAGHDTLTGLPNRALFQDRMSRALARSHRTGSLMALMYLDIDKFKSVNDTHGHDVGDALIREFARRLTECIRSTDTAARLGGDEFAAILEGLDEAAAGREIAEKILLAMREEFVLGAVRLAVSTSIGLAYCQGNAAMPAEAIVKRADLALYAAKAAGRDTFRIAEEAAA